MHHPNSIQINIPDPCSQNWDEMTPAAQGRFCAHCQKTVIDFTAWSDTALYNFFSKDNGHTCGRFLTTQINRPINIPCQPHSRLYRIAIALGMTVLFTQTPDVLAQSRPPKVEQTTPLQKPQPGGTNACSINGQVTDGASKEPLINAAVQVFQNGVLKGGTVTDYDGMFVIKPLEAGRYDVIALYNGFDSLVEKDVIVMPDSTSTRKFAMKQIPGRILPRVVIMGAGAGLINRDNITSSSVRVTENTSHLPAIATQAAVKPDNAKTEISICPIPTYLIPDMDNPAMTIFTREDINHMPQ